MIETLAKPAPAPLCERYTEADLDLLEPGARERFLQDGASWDEVAPLVAWEVLYRKEPELYDRLISGEEIHPAVIGTLPAARRCVEVGAGTGRLTIDLSPRCGEVVAIEPATSLRAILSGRVSPLGNVEVRDGYFDATGLEDASADLVVSCSAFTSDEAHGGEAGLNELERIAAPGGMVAFVWPSDVDWLRKRGYTYQSYPGQSYPGQSYPGDMAVSFASKEEAVELARIFYPEAVDEIARLASAEVPYEVPYEVLGMNPPRDIAWKLIP